MNEIADMLADMDDAEDCDIYIEHPDAQELTNEDSNDENDGNDTNTSCLSGRQLRASAHLQHRKHHSSENSDNENEEVICKSKKRKISNIKWKSVVNKSVQEIIFPERNHSSIAGFTPEQLFELIFDDDIIQLLVEETNKYAHQKNNMSFSVTKEEMLVLLSILIVSG